MIICYEGTLGGGKSYHAVREICRCLAAGQYVYANIPLRWAAVRRWCQRNYGVRPLSSQYHSISFDELDKLHSIVRGGTPDCPALLVVDEVHLYFNARDWAQTSRRFLEWLTQSRKLNVNIIFITQNCLNMDKQFIRLLGRYYHFRDLRGWKIPGLGVACPFPLFFSAEIDQDHRTVLARHFERIDNSVFGLYDSRQLFDGMQQGFAGAGLERVKHERLGAIRRRARNIYNPHWRLKRCVFFSFFF